MKLRLYCRVKKLHRTSKAKKLHHTSKAKKPHHTAKAKKRVILRFQTVKMKAMWNLVSKAWTFA